MILKLRVFKKDKYWYCDYRGVLCRFTCWHNALSHGIKLLKRGWMCCNTNRHAMHHNYYAKKI